MELANPVLRFDECTRDLDNKWPWFDDSIFSQIGRLDDPRLDQAKELLHRINTRQFYSLVGELLLPPTSNGSQKKIFSIEHLFQFNKSPSLMQDDIFITKATINFALQDRNPVDHVKFYNNANVVSSFKVLKQQLSNSYPNEFMDTYFRVFVKRREQLPEAKKMFNDFCRFQNLGDYKSPVEPTPKPFATPLKRRGTKAIPQTAISKKIKLEFNATQ